MDGLSPHQPGAETELDYSLGDLSGRVLVVDDVGIHEFPPTLWHIMILPVRRVIH